MPFALLVPAIEVVNYSGESFSVNSVAPGITDFFTLNGGTGSGLLLLSGDIVWTSKVGKGPKG